MLGFQLHSAAQGEGACHGLCWLAPKCGGDVLAWLIVGGLWLRPSENKKSDDGERKRKSEREGEGIAMDREEGGSRVG
jgi:hypothetical protein